jgi:hypothetical protein
MVPELRFRHLWALSLEIRPMPNTIPKAAPTKREALRALLADGQWHHMNELRAVGGWRYGARLLEIRQEHHITIEHRSAGADNEFEYRAVIDAQAVLPLTKPKPSARARIEQLARENRELRQRLAALEGGAAHG